MMKQTEVLPLTVYLCTLVPSAFRGCINEDWYHWLGERSTDCSCFVNHQADG